MALLSANTAASGALNTGIAVNVRASASAVDVEKCASMIASHLLSCGKACSTNRLPVYFCNAAAALPHIKAGKLRALAVTSTKRSGALPDVPTLSEMGVRGVEVYEWNGMHLPAGTPPAVVERLSAALRQALDAPDVRQRLAEVAAEPFPGGRADAARFVDSEIERFAKVIKAFGIKAE